MRSFFSVLTICITALIMYFAFLFHSNANNAKNKDASMQAVYGDCVDLLMSIKGRYEKRNYYPEHQSEYQYTITFESAKQDCANLVNASKKNSNRNI